MTGFVDQWTRVNAAPVTSVRKWLSENGTPPYIYTVDDAIPSDIADEINRIWNNAYAIRTNDPVDEFIRVTLGIPLPSLTTLEPVA